MGNHSVEFELWYDGAWHPAPILSRDKLRFRRGVTDPGSDSEPARASFTLDNSSGAYAPRSVVSALYGRIGQNTKGRLIIDGAVRMTGEVAKWAPTRSIKGSGSTRIELAGVLRRIGRGTDPLESALYRANTVTSPATAYWSLEDPKGSARANGSPGLMTALGGVAFAADVLDIPGSTGQVDTSGGGTLIGSASSPAFASTGWQVEFVAGYRHTTVGLPPIIVSITTTGTFQVNLVVNAALWDGAAHHLAFQLTQVGADVSIDSYRDGVFATNQVIAGQTLGVPQDVYINQPGNTGDDVPIISHLALRATLSDPATRAAAVAGHTGETAADRFTRLCTEQAITPTVVGDPAESVPMGPQQTVTFLEQLDEIAATDDASIFETRTDVGLTMRTGVSKMNQPPAFTISYLGQIEPTLEPVIGDKGIRNDVTAAAPSGATRRVQQLTGPHNVELPEDDPQGVGRYKTRIEVNPATVDALTDAAGWRVSLGTYAGTWYAEVTADLDAAPGIAAAVAALDIGDVLAISELPVDEALDTVECLIIGIEESVPPKRRTVTFYCIPADPYRVGLLAATSGDTDPFVGHLDTDDSATVLDVAAAASSFLVRTNSGPLWTQDADDLPFDIIVGGQRVSVSDIDPAVNDAFGRTVANGWASEPTSGVAYVTSGGAASDYAVAAGVGTMAMTSANVFRSAVLNVGTSHKSIIAQIALNVGNASGGSITQWICGRYQDANNYWVARLDLSTAGGVQLNIFKRVAGTLSSSLGSAGTIGTGHTAGDLWRVRVDDFGTYHAATAWQGTLAEQPATPQIIVTGDSDIPVGTSLGLLVRREASNTDAGLIASWDNLMVVNPQRFTVQPTGRQVIYPIPAGAAVTVQQPIILSL